MLCVRSHSQRRLGWGWDSGPPGPRDCALLGTVCSLLVSKEQGPGGVTERIGLGGEVEDLWERERPDTWEALLVGRSKWIRSG